MSEFSFAEIVTRDYLLGGGSACVSKIKSSFQKVVESSTQNGGLNQLTKVFQLCNRLNNTRDVEVLVNWIEHALIALAEFDYPYPVS